MQLIDLECAPNCPSSKFLSRAEFSSIFPDEMPKKMSFIFKHGVPVEIDEDVANVLIDKYPKSFECGVSKNR